MDRELDLKGQWAANGKSPSEKSHEESGKSSPQDGPVKQRQQRLDLLTLIDIDINR